MQINQLSWTLPGIVCVGVFALSSACAGDAAPELQCPNPDETSGPSGSGGSGSTGSTGSSMTEDFTAQEIAAKLHGCRKLRYETLGSFLVSRGVDTTTFGGAGNCQVDADGPMCDPGERCYCETPPCQEVGADPGNQGLCVTTPETPGFLYSTGEDSFSVPRMDSRRSEKDGHTSASALRLFDIFIQAAPQIIANIENPVEAPACVLNGDTFPMFDPVDGSCVAESISCLIGYPATQDHVLLCNLVLDKADPFDAADVQRKQYIAVASMLAAAHSCE